MGERVDLLELNLCSSNGRIECSAFAQCDGRRVWMVELWAAEARRQLARRKQNVPQLAEGGHCSLLRRSHADDHGPATQFSKQHS